MCARQPRGHSRDIGDEIPAPADTVDGFDEFRPQFRRPPPSDTCSSLATSGDNADVNRQTPSVCQTAGWTRRTNALPTVSSVRNGFSIVCSSCYYYCLKEIWETKKQVVRQVEEKNDEWWKATPSALRRASTPPRSPLVPHFPVLIRNEYNHPHRKTTSIRCRGPHYSLILFSIDTFTICIFQYNCARILLPFIASTESRDPVFSNYFHWRIKYVTDCDNHSCFPPPSGFFNISNHLPFKFAIQCSFCIRTMSLNEW